MSVPPSPDPATAPAAPVGAGEREAALLQEVRALRIDNERLRQERARGLGALPGAGAAPAMEVPLNLRAEVRSLHESGLTVAPQMDYEALLASMSTVFPIGIFRTNADGYLTHIDGSLQRIFELNSAEFKNFGWLQKVHPDDLQRVEAAWAEGIQRGTALSLEFRLRHADGRIAHVLARNSPILSADGEVEAQHGFLQDISSLRQLEAEAQIKDNLNRQIIASSPDCTKVLDLEGRVVQMTEKGCQLVEVDDFETVRNSVWADWWAGEGHAMAWAAVRAAAGGSNGRFVAFANTFKGTPKWWDTVVTPVKDGKGQAIMLLAISRDITEFHRQRTEIQTLNDSLESRVAQRTQELAQANQGISEALHQASQLYNHAPCGYHSIDAQGLFVRVNQTELNWLGHEREALVGQRGFSEFVRPDQVSTANELLQQLIRLGSTAPTEICLLRRDGSELWVLLSGTVVTDKQGRFLHTNNTVVDITARHAAEVALAAQRNFLQTITNSVPVQLAYYDRQLVCRFANAAYARWSNGPSAGLLGRHLSEIAHPDNYAEGLPLVESVLQGQSHRFEGERTFPDGHRFYANIVYTPYIDNGEVEGLFIQILDISNRRATELQVAEANAQLREALALSQNLYNQAPCGYHSLDAQGLYVAINDTELRWIGFTREEVVGKLDFRSFILPMDGPLIEERLSRLAHSDVSESTELEVRRRDGSTFPVLVSSSAVRDEQGRFLRSNNTVVDITERKAAESALRENQRFLQTITDQVPGAIAYVDTALRFRFANTEHHRLYGLAAEKIIGLHASDCLPADIWADVAPHLQAALSGAAQKFEAWRHDPEGAPMCVSAQYLPDIHEGLVKGIFVQVTDITDHKRVEERMAHLNEELELRIKERSLELLESEQRFRLMVDNLRDYCIFFFDTEGRISDWTDSAQRMEGYSPTETIGRHYSLLFKRKTPEEALRTGQRMMETAAARGQHEVHGWYERKDGSQYWAHSVIIALRDDAEELRGFAKINRDMSDAKRLDDLMRNINDELENRVAERTEQLLAANKDLESFSYSVSHDLRSPLRHISSFVSLLEEHLAESHDEEALRYLGTIGNSARHMSQLIDGLLAFSRLGRAAVHLVEVDFAMLVDDVVAQLAHDAQGREVEWLIPTDLPMVQGDPLLLREVWTNLLGNALKYSRPRAAARIEVGWSVDPAVGYIFSITDNGVGFDTQYAQKLFGVFQRLHRASEFEGTGIGLALVRRILERHGGSIWADSRLGEGSVFSFSLPFEGASPMTHFLDSIPSFLDT